MPKLSKKTTKRQDKKELIMNTALEIFAEIGFHASSVSAITKKAGISKGLLYNYFDSKEELLKKIIYSGLDEFIEIFDPNKDGILTDSEFDFFIDQTFEILKNNIRFWRLYFSVIMQSGVVELIKDKILELLVPYLTTMTQYFRSKGKKNPKAYSYLFGAMIDGVTMNYVMQPDTYPLDEIKKIIIEQFK